MTHTKTPTFRAAALAAAVAVGAVAPAQAKTATVPHTWAITTVDEDGRITAPIAVDEITPSDDDQVLWHNYINCGC